MTIKRMPEIGVLLPDIDESKHDFNWFNARFGESIAKEITAYLYCLACDLDGAAYFNIDVFIEMIKVQDAKTVCFERVVENKSILRKSQ